MNLEPFQQKGFVELPNGELAKPSRMKTAQQHNAPLLGESDCLPKPSSQRIDALGGRDSREDNGGDQTPGSGVCVPPRANFIIKPSTDEQKLNKTERRYLGELRRLGYPYIGIQNITLKLADDTRYTCDFNFLDENGHLVFDEVKGFFRDDAKVKIKVAARQYRMFKFRVVRKTKTGWDIQEVNL